MNNNQKINTIQIGIVSNRLANLTYVSNNCIMHCCFGPKSGFSERLAVLLTLTHLSNNVSSKDISQPRKELSREQALILTVNIQIFRKSLSRISYCKLANFKTIILIIRSSLMFQHNAFTPCRSLLLSKLIQRFKFSLECFKVDWCLI